MPNPRITLKARLWDDALRIAVLLNTWTESLFWWVRRRHDMYYDLREDD